MVLISFAFSVGAVATVAVVVVVVDVVIVVVVGDVVDVVIVVVSLLTNVIGCKLRVTANAENQSGRSFLPMKDLQKHRWTDTKSETYGTASLG